MIRVGPSLQFVFESAKDKLLVSLLRLFMFHSFFKYTSKQTRPEITH